jgi:predicted  nucleic acid-binding Zn-ribbon protein
MTDQVLELMQSLEDEYLYTKAKVSLFEDKIKTEKEKLKDIEDQLAKYFRATRQKSLKTTAGIGAVNKQQRYYNLTNDASMEQHIEWAIEHNELETVSMRLKVSGIDEYKENNDGELPPGVEEGSKYNVTVSIPRHMLNDAKQNILKKVKR